MPTFITRDKPTRMHRNCLQLKLLFTINKSLDTCIPANSLWHIEFVMLSKSVQFPKSCIYQFHFKVIKTVISGADHTKIGWISQESKKLASSCRKLYMCDCKFYSNTEGLGVRINLEYQS